MTAAGIVLAAFLGAIFGSFVTVVAHRVPRGASVLGPRSVCPDCGAEIAARDNVPIFSWLALRGRSRCCGEPISVRYPLTEAALAVFFVAVALRFQGDAGELVLGLIFVSTLLAITLTDLERRIIPNRILIFAAILAVVVAAISDPGSLPERLAAAVGAGGVLFLSALAYPGGMGMGDVKLAAMMGLFLGVWVVPALLVALLAGSLVGVALIVRDGAEARKRAIPFGPFLALGGVVGLLAGSSLIDLYLSTFT
ncbi:MAG: leader peptidase (prepilin peptidase) / N-methyltransferase [Solirubrobacterales bacterium]|jgi:leader peptidase (prepilin peptidase)/N-methyltransferase|nr:leader peptidase (prepilin peptidase) / N-methyltransferase [Solirubrobacterales bacterium]